MRYIGVSGKRSCRLNTRAARGLLLGALLWGIAAGAERMPFAIALPYLSVVFINGTHTLDEVFISYGSRNEGWAISDGNDRYVKITPRLREDRTSKEMPQFAHLLTLFETRRLEQVTRSFLRVLTIFEHDLQAGNWGKLLYLDGAFPAFLRGFYYLVSAAYNSREVLPAVACISDTLYDESFDSPKTGRRISRWRSDPEQVTKLRIITKELIFHLEQYRTRDLAAIKFNPRSQDPFKRPAPHFAEAYGLFVRIYFGIKPAPGK